MLFVQFDSKHRGAGAVAHELARELSTFYPIAPAYLTSSLRDEPLSYEELIVVGHSLGGVVVRAAVADSIERWRDGGHRLPAPPLVHATVRLFSPAISGARLAGLPGLVQVTPTVGTALEMYLTRSPSYRDLTDGKYLPQLQRRTQDLAGKFDTLPALHPAILWADPETVVSCVAYDTDSAVNIDYAAGKKHRAVCKPVDAPDLRRSYTLPWEFVEAGARS
jgi:hypothetical protein